ncbi:cobalt transport protein CbiN [Porphyromonas macacae]|uniref:Cobalt transport protein CbiN n=1 Tax=Porphyromonas macacae TaxID=28115 RepID=A0A379E9L6_9PORP|nr:energy-coupling factor ABC transporter substrate-binding protein [Porphyromonas macacae]SUB89024.1 cobalt transport protein CbiN [Porphyromonas macacae]
MKKKTTHIIILLICGILFIAAPVMSIFFDFGSGTDDQAGEMIQSINPSYEPNALWQGFEPSETAEPWLFVLQVVIGIIIFAYAFGLLLKQRKENI